MPLSTPHSEWRFKPVEGDADSCEIDFTVTFEVASFLHASAIQIFFDDVALTQLNAFVSRARKVYGARPTARRAASASASASAAAKPGKEDSKPQDQRKDSVASRQSPDLPEGMSELASHRIKGGASAESLDEFAHIFRRFASAEGKLDYRGFCSACAELGEAYADFKDIAASSVISGAVFSSLETSARPHKDWLSMDDFVVGVYMMTKGTFEQKAHNLFQLIDTSGDGKISREELTRALRRRVATVRKMFPSLLRDQVQIQLQLVEEQEGGAASQLAREQSEDAAIAQGVQALEALMAEIEAEIPLAVNQVFLEADLDQDDLIHEQEWLLAWQAHPEFVELLSIEGLKKVAQWAAVVRGDANVPELLPDQPDTRLTHID